MSMPSSSGVQPLWNHSYFFSNTRDKATFFTPNAALVLEFFPTTPGKVCLITKNTDKTTVHKRIT